jgi:hypothetical protein
LFCGNGPVGLPALTRTPPTLAPEAVLESIPAANPATITATKSFLMTVSSLSRQLAGALNTGKSFATFPDE